MRRLVFVLFLLVAYPVQATEFSVDTTVDALDASPGDGICADATGACTLRAAVMETNALAGEDVVNVPAGTYPLSSIGGIGIGAWDGGLTVSGAGADATIIDAAGLPPAGNPPEPEDFALHVGPLGEGAGPVVLTGLAIIGSGYGVGAFASNVQLSGVAITGNSVGVQQFDAGDLRIEQSLIVGNDSGLVSYGFMSCKVSCAPCVMGTLSLENTTVSGSVNLGFGGIFGDDCGNVTRIVNSTLMTTPLYGLYGAFVFAPTTLDRSIIGGPCLIPNWLPNYLTSGGHNIGTDGTCNLTDPTDLPNTDPMLGPLQDNGGPTETHALLPGSPAIDAIPTADCTWDDDGDPETPEVPLRIDQRGASRPQGVGCDIGAVEVTRCSDGRDDDADGRVDAEDPGCRDALSVRENPQCQDGRDNDGQVGIDFDGGASLDLDGDGFIDAAFNPDTPAVAAPDPQCVGKPWRTSEKSGCGLGGELLLLLPLLDALRRRPRFPLERTLRARAHAPESCGQCGSRAAMAARLSAMGRVVSTTTCCPGATSFSGGSQRAR